MNKHLAAIRAGEVTASNVIGIRKAFNAFERERQGLSVSCTAPRISADDYSAIERETPTAAPRVVGELHDSGLKVLRNRRYRKRLERVQPIIDSLESFHLVGFHWIDSLHVAPVYEARSPVGAFMFHNVAWQSGGDGPEIVSILPVDVEFIPSSFGGGWLAPATVKARTAGESIMESAAEFMAPVGRDAWLVEPCDVADMVTAFHEAGCTVTLS